MSECPSTYLRYVVVEVPSPAIGARATWLGRVSTAAEGFSILEARIAEYLTGGGSQPRVALVDCNDQRVLGWYADAPPLDGFVSRVVEYARGFPPAEGSYVRNAGHGSGGAPSASDSASFDLALSALRENPELDEPAEDPDPSLQPLIDAFVREYYACRVNRGLYESLCDNLVDADDPFEFDEEPVHAVRRTALIELLSRRSPAEVREGLGLGPGKRLRVADWIAYVIQVELPNLLEDEDATQMIGPVLVRDSHGRSVSMIKSLRGGIGGDVEVHWHGARATWADFQRELGRDWISSPEDFARLPAAEQRAIIRKARER